MKSSTKNYSECRQSHKSDDVCETCSKRFVCWTSGEHTYEVGVYFDFVELSEILQDMVLTSEQLSDSLNKLSKELSRRD